MGETRFPGIGSRRYKAADSRMDDTSNMDQHLNDVFKMS